MMLMGKLNISHYSVIVTLCNTSSFPKARKKNSKSYCQSISIC